MSTLYDQDDDIDETNLVCREELNHGDYRLDCILTRESSGYPNQNKVFQVDIRLKFSGEVVGYLFGYLLSMYSRPRADFYLTAEPIDAELWHVVKVFCDSRGVASRIDHPALQSSPCKNRGGFFHIHTMEIKKDHRGNDLGLHMIHQALAFLQFAWSIAVISPGSLNYPKYEPVHSYQEIRENEGAIENLMVKLTQYYGRMGFQQASERYAEVMFLTRDGYLKSQQWIPKSQVSQIRVFRPTPNGAEKGTMVDETGHKPQAD